MVPHLESRGWRPWVLALRHSSYQHGVVPGRLPVPISESQVLTFSHEEIDPRPELRQKLEHFFWYLLSAPGHTRHWCLYSSLYFTDDFGRCHVPGLLNLCRSHGWPRPDVVLSTVPPGGAIILGASLASHFGSKWVVDFRDLRALRDDRSKLLVFLDKRLEGWLLRRADGLVGVSPTGTRLLEAAYTKPSVTVFNGFEISMPAPGARPSGGVEGHLYYAGLLYEHQMSAVKLLIESLVELRSRGTKPTLFLRLLPGPQCLTLRLKQWVFEHQLSDQVLFGEPVDSEQCRVEAENASVNLVFEDLDTVGHSSKATITGKVMEFINYRAPILAVARPDSDIGTVLSGSGAGWLVSSRREIVDRLGNLPSSLKERTLAPYSRSEQSRILAEFLDRVVDA